MAEPSTYFWRDQPPSLADAQRLVGGYVQRVFLKDGRPMLVDEEGLLKQLPKNEVASELFGATIVGNVLVLEGKAKAGWA